MFARTKVLAARFRSALFTAALVLPILAVPSAQAHAGVFLSVGIAPPPLPVYAQPPIPAPGYLWTPGYWAFGNAGYYWVPGVWVHPPAVGLLWTPGYWGFAGGLYAWHPGYWGPHVGFYGGVNYGFGYGGIGFVGGEWHGGVFAYNGAVNNFGGVHVTNVYVNRTVVQQNTIVNANHVAFNGGTGVQARPTAAQQQYASQQHIAPTATQMQHQTAASQDHSQLASVNHGHPGTAAVSSHAAYHPNLRAANQSQRISNGLRSGQLSAGQAARDNQRQANINSQVAANRAANGGRLTGQQRQQINRKQNNASRQIYRQRHGNRP